MEIKFIALLTGVTAVAVSIKPFLQNIKNHKVKVYFTLPGWTLFLMGLGVVLGLSIRKFQPSTGATITLGLFAFIPLYAWIDAKIIYKKASWKIKEYVWGCLYELGFVSLGTSLCLFLFH
jgi:hypothetical protein